MLLPRAPLPCALAAIVALATGCPEKDPDPPADPTASATVNGGVIGRADFEQELAREAAGEPLESLPTTEQAMLVKRTLLSTLVERTLVLQAVRQANIQVSP